MTSGVIKKSHQINTEIRKSNVGNIMLVISIPYLFLYIFTVVHPVSIKTCFSIEGAALCVFPGHSDALQILAYDIVPVLYRLSRSSACCTHFLGYGLYILCFIY